MGIFSIFFNMKVYCLFSFELRRWGDSNEKTQYTIFNIKKKITLIIPTLQLWNFSQGPKNEFETAVVKEPLKFYCIEKNKQRKKPALNPMMHQVIVN